VRKQFSVILSITAVLTAASFYGLPWPAAATLIAALTILLAYLRFERTLASTRVIAVLGVLTAVAVGLRQALHGVGASPIFFVIILAGYAFGWTEGFVVGSSSILVSNFVVGGHGPWTPYQMAAAGLVGAAAGLIPKTRDRRLSLALLAVYGFVSAFAYGAVTDVFFWLAFVRERTPATYLAVHLAGVVHNTVRGVGNVFFIALLGRPVLRVLARFKNKFYIEYINQPLSKVDQMSHLHSPFGSLDGS
jgi:energy-coupling factor transport system substrate-specific component